MIPFGVKSKTWATAFMIAVSGTVLVPKVSTATETGFATPIAYATCTSHRRASLAATMFFATQRAA
jgi:hypothetical protein